ncbi:MAG: hypothetical protein AAF891_01925 [Pseudomonadota bacterium]
MKLVFATTATALILASSAFAMTPNVVTDHRAAAQNAIGQVTSGAQQVISLEAYGLDGRSKALRKSDSVSVYTFSGTTKPADSTDIR